MIILYFENENVRKAYLKQLSIIIFSFTVLKLLDKNIYFNISYKNNMDDNSLWL